MWSMSFYKEKNDTRYIAVTLRCLYLYLVDHYLIFVILEELCNKYQKRKLMVSIFYHLILQYLKIC